VGSPNTVLWSNDTLNFNLFWQPEVQLPELLMQFVIFFFALSWWTNKWPWNIQ